MRRPCAIGLVCVQLGHSLPAVGLHGLRLSAWLLEAARAKTRMTPVAQRLAEAPAA